MSARISAGPKGRETSVQHFLGAVRRGSVSTIGELEIDPLWRTSVRQALFDFETIYRQEQLRLVRLAHLITGSNAVAEELVHDAFVAAYRRWDRISEPAGYLYRSVVNRSRSVLRRRALEWRHRPDPSDAVMPPEIDEVWEALRRIPVRRRTVLVLRYYEDLSVDQIAEAIGARPGTVRSLIHRAQESLRKELGQ